MNRQDTKKLLQECDAGTKMAVTSIEEVLKNVRSSELKKLLNETMDHHARLGNEIHEKLNRLNAEEKEPSVMAKGMSWMKTNMKMNMDGSDAAIAELITDGSNMGVKSLCRYLNQYKTADDETKDLCRRLIGIEEQLIKELQPYL